MNINVLLGIAKFSAIFIALWQGFLISNLQKDKLYLTQKNDLFESQKYQSISLETRNEELKNKVNWLEEENKNIKENLSNQIACLKSKGKIAAIRHKLLQPNYFKSLVIGKSRLAVLRVLGDPDEQNDFSFEDNPQSTWTYNNQIAHPDSTLDGKGHRAKIYFDRQVVYLVKFESD